MQRLPGADGGLVEPLASERIDLRMNGDGGHRLNGAGKAQILAEAQHGFHAGIRAWSKIHVGQQLAANATRPADNDRENLRRFVDEQVPRLKRYRDYREDGKHKIMALDGAELESCASKTGAI